MGRIGSDRNDVLVAMQCLLFYEANRGKGPSRKLADFMPYLPEHRYQQTPQEQRAVLRQILRRPALDTTDPASKKVV